MTGREVPMLSSNLIGRSECFRSIILASNKQPKRKNSSGLLTEFSKNKHKHFLRYTKHIKSNNTADITIIKISIIKNTSIIKDQ